ncbi:MAG TPA: hypothetical protein VNT75_24225 [Symbiobacteriaceae bacterium]|nr:hypothetical protein [Symbiobacteriaceae bacterium]
MEIYIFGAGASAAEGAPATQDFFARSWELLAPDFDGRIRSVWRFLSDLFGVPVSGPDAFRFVPAVDEVISLVDWSLHANQGLGHTYDPPRLHQVRRDLEHLLWATLDAVCRTRGAQAEGPHTRFVRTLAATRDLARTTLISLNYDTLLDDALTAAGLAPDYGLGRGGRGPLLAKLHGSLNWGLCQACSQIEVARTACSRCGNGGLHGLIISPTWLKSYGGAHLQQLWDLALDRLRQAERIVFIGYSMPAADIAIYHLLRRAMLAGPGQRRRPAIHVINHSEPAVSRFTHLFGPDCTFDLDGFYGQV